MTDYSTSTIHFAWLDANIYTKENKELLSKIRQFNKETMEFIDEGECQRFLGRGVGDPRRFIFIVSGGLGQQLVPDLHERENIVSIYVYCGNKTYHEIWASNYHKVRVVNTPDDLLDELRRDRQRHHGS